MQVSHLIGKKLSELIKHASTVMRSVNMLSNKRKVLPTGGFSKYATRN